MQTVLRILLVYLCVLQALFAGTVAIAESGLHNPISEFQFDQPDIHLNPSIAGVTCFEVNESENSENSNKVINYFSKLVLSIVNKGLISDLLYSNIGFYTYCSDKAPNTPLYILYHSFKLPHVC